MKERFKPVLDISRDYMKPRFTFLARFVAKMSKLVFTCFGGHIQHDKMMMGGPDDIRAGSTFVLLYHGVLLNYRVSLKKGSFGILLQWRLWVAPKGWISVKNIVKHLFFI